MQSQQVQKDKIKDRSQEPSILKYMKKDSNEGQKMTEQTITQAKNVNGQTSDNHNNHKESDKNIENGKSNQIEQEHNNVSDAVSKQNINQNTAIQIEDDDDIQIIGVNIVPKQNNGQPKKVDSGNVVNTKQKKKNNLRCKVCKKGGTNSSFKPCKECERVFHYECAGLKKEVDKDRKYVCDLCKDKQKQKKVAEREKEKKKKIKDKEKEKERQLKLETILAEAKKKLVEQPKDKVKEETQKAHEEFCQRYPQYIENKKIKYPIEDTLLTIYDKLFTDTQNLSKRPYPQQSKIIPQEFMSDILMIWNFLNSFSEHLENMKFTKEQLYIAIVNQRQFIMLFCCKDHKGEESHNLLNHIFKNLVRFPVLDIYYTHKIDNNKELSDQPFFIITRVAKELELLDKIMKIIWPEFIRHLSYFQQYSINFKDDTDIAEIIEKFKLSDFSSFYDLNTKQRIKFMCLLIACVDDSDSFHDGVIGYKQDQVHDMTKERNDLQVEIKKEEAEFQALDAKVKALEQTQKSEQEAILETLSRAESLKKQKEFEADKKELLRLKNQANKFEQQLIKKKNKCQQLTFDLPHYINTAQLLGYDHNKSEFWVKFQFDSLISILNLKISHNLQFFHNDRKTIYLRYKESIIDDDRVWCFYNTKQDITNLIKSLNKKGMREKNLYDNLMYLVKNEYLQYKFEDLEKKQSNNAQNGNQQKNNQGQPVQTTLQFSGKKEQNGLQNEENNSEEKKQMDIEDTKKHENDEQKDKLQNQDEQKTADDEMHIDETKDSILQFISNYDTSDANKTQGTTQKKKNAKTQQQNEKDLSVFERAVCTFKDIANIILETEKGITDYLERRKCRWANKQTRETFRELVNTTTDPQQILTLLDQLSEGFQSVDHMYIKLNTKAQENEEDNTKIDQEEDDDNQPVCSDDESFQGVGKNKNDKTSNDKQGELQKYTLEYFENHSQMRSKKFPMRIWGIYSEKCKKNWQNLPMVNVMSAYLSTYLFCTIIQKFLKRKNEQQEEKEQNEQQNMIYYTQNDDKKNNTQANNNQKRKLMSYSELEQYKYSDNGIRKSDRQKNRKNDFTEPNYDLEDFEEEQEEQEHSQSDEKNSEEYSNKNNKNKKNKKSNKKDNEEEYSLDEESESLEDEQKIQSEQDEMDEEVESKQKPKGKRILRKQKDIKQSKNIKNESEDEEYDESKQEEDQKNMKKKNNNINGKSNQKQVKAQQNEYEEEQEEEFQFQKNKSPTENKNNKKTSKRQQNDEESEEESEEEFNKSNKKNNKNTKSKEADSLSSQEWDDECKVCGETGEVLMCDTCPSVFHLKCIHLKALPDGDWSCLDCQEKILKSRQTRSTANKRKNK